MDVQASRPRLHDGWAWICMAGCPSWNQHVLLAFARPAWATLILFYTPGTIRKYLNLNTGINLRKSSSLSFCEIKERIASGCLPMYLKEVLRTRCGSRAAIYFSTKRCYPHVSVVGEVSLNRDKIWASKRDNLSVFMCCNQNGPPNCHWYPPFNRDCSQWQTTCVMNDLLCV